MRLFPEVKAAPRAEGRPALRAAGFAVALVVAALLPSPSCAQSFPGSTPAYYPAPAYPQAYPQTYQPASPAQQPVTQQQFMQAMQALSQQNQNQQQGNAAAAPAAAADLGDINDPNSAAYKANSLADHAAAQRTENATLDQQSLSVQQGLDQGNPPPDMVQLQEVEKYQNGAGSGISDYPVSTDISLDVRRQAQREAALSYGARGGLAKRNFEIMEQMRGFSKALDRVFNFRALLIRAPSGLLIEPPIVDESDKALVIADNGDEAAVADRVYDINQRAKIVSAPRDWRQYLIQSWSQTVPPPPRVLWPKNPQEQAEWDVWVQEGWGAGVKQADQIFQDNVNRLVADFRGMVRYRVLLAQNMITAPYAMQEDRGVTGNANQMRVGDSAIKITDPSQFLKKAALWQPADQ
ncbi:MAG: type IV secretory system conjugative DNA transfer family protein [Alphaproteobacteria bacterium]|nr:type IV secretory system conjugative DNA transfer family protein [Alphaproteobacteria bacterium]